LALQPSETEERNDVSLGRAFACCHEKKAVNRLGFSKELAQKMEGQIFGKEIIREFYCG